MKKYILLSLFSMQVFAGDLVFKQGFEATGLVSGTVTGLSSAGLSINLNVSGNDEVLIITENGEFIFFMTVTIGASYEVTLLTLPSAPPQSCSISNAIGVVANNGVTNILVTCGASNNWDQMNWDTGDWN